MTITFEPIGILHTPYKAKEGMPIQPKGAIGVRGKIIVDKEFSAGLKDLNGFSHIMVIYYFHQSVGFDLRTVPFLDTEERGVFSTRAPRRPNAIGLSVVKLLNIEENVIHIENVDMLDGTPLLDIKPYISAFDNYETDKNGWIENKTNQLDEIKSDHRFNK